MSDVVLVLGMHRSGTSAVAGVLTKLGGGAPRRLMPAHPTNVRGFFESQPIAEFHDELLKSAGSKWADWRQFNPAWRQSSTAEDFRRRAKELFAAEFDGATLPVLEDPRMCRITPFWLDVLREMQAKPHVVMPIRSPLDVARSLGPIHGLSLTHGLLLWLRHVLDAEWHTRSTARSIFAWKDFCSDWRGVCQKIAAEAELPWPRMSDRAAAEIDRFLSKDLVHHETDDAALAAHGDINEWTLRAYEALLELGRNPHSNSAMATLDDVRQMLDQASGIFGRLLADYEIDLEDARGQAKATEAELDALRARHLETLAEKAAALAELAARADAAERAREEAERQKEPLTHALAAVREANERITAELRSQSLQLNETAAGLSEALAERELVSQRPGRDGGGASGSPRRDRSARRNPCRAISAQCGGQARPRRCGARKG